MTAFTPHLYRIEIAPDLIEKTFMGSVAIEGRGWSSQAANYGSMPWN
jgi:hypothetical protein